MFLVKLFHIYLFVHLSCMFELNVHLRGFGSLFVSFLLTVFLCLCVCLFLVCLCFYLFLIFVFWCPTYLFRVLCQMSKKFENENSKKNWQSYVGETFHSKLFQISERGLYKKNQTAALRQAKFYLLQQASAAVDRLLRVPQ